MRQFFDKRFIFIVLLIALILFFRYSQVGQYITIKNIKMNKIFLMQYVEHNYFFSVLLYILLYTILTIIGFPVVMVLTVAGGFFFGTLWNVLYTNIGATIGSSISFLFMRYFLGGFLRKKFSRRMEKFDCEFKTYGYSYLLSIHFVSVIPLAVVNIFASLANVSFWTFLWTTSIGILPGSFVYSFAGKQLATLDSVRDVFSWSMMLAFLALFVLAILPILIRRGKGLKKNGGVS